MSSDKLGNEMKVLEYNDSLNADRYHIFRLDGRGFSSFTKKAGFVKPFDNHFSNIMNEVTQLLVKQSGFNIIYATTHSDEISLLIHPHEDQFGLRREKVVSTLSGLASACFTHAIFGLPRLITIDRYPTFDCRSISLHDSVQIKDYFRWRMLDSKRNAVNSHIYYYFIQNDNFSVASANKFLNSKNNKQRLEFLAKNDVSIFNWQEYGKAYFWDTYVKNAVHGITNKPVQAIRNRLICFDNDMNDDSHNIKLDEIINKISI